MLKLGRGVVGVCPWEAVIRKLKKVKNYFLMV